MTKLTMIALTSLFLASCGSSGGGGEALPAYDLNGVWRVTETIVTLDGDCDPEALGSKIVNIWRFVVEGNTLYVSEHLCSGDCPVTEIHVTGDQATWSWGEHDEGFIIERSGATTFTATTFVGPGQLRVTEKSTGRSCVAGIQLSGVKVSASAALHGLPPPTRHRF